MSPTAQIRVENLPAFERLYVAAKQVAFEYRQYGPVSFTALEQLHKAVAGIEEYPEGDPE